MFGQVTKQKLVESEAQRRALETALVLKTDDYDHNYAELKEISGKYTALLVELGEATVRANEADLESAAHEQLALEWKELSNTLLEENKDLCRQLELLNAVLKQLRIVVKLPAKK